MEFSCFRNSVQRERGDVDATRFRRRSHVNDHLIQHLQLETALEGHSGCVNCLDWNQRGTLLASGSDDTNVIIWDAFRHQNIHTVKTQHHGNIFSVKFMPSTSDHVMATGAADGHIFIHDLVGNEPLCAYNVEGRVKRLVNTQAEPNALISASEDGVVREYDIRDPAPSSGRILADLTKRCGGGTECKCVAISPTDPYCIAVGATDYYVRLYDRRMLDVHTQARYFIPGHLRSKQNEHKLQLRNLCVTYVAFSPCGNDVLVNLGGEQIYVFDINNRAKPLSIDTKLRYQCNGVKKHSTEDLEDAALHFEHAPKRSKSSSGCGTSTHKHVNVKNGKAASHWAENPAKFESKTPENALADRYKTIGNELFLEQKYTAAINMYNKAIAISPRSVVYSNRAAAFIKREWDGDFYAALKDCYTALQTNPSDVKAHYRLARCMFELKWFEEAMSCMKEFKSYHPDHSNSTACIALEKDIKVALKQRDNGSKKAQVKSDNTSEEEVALRASSYDYKSRYCGHCNTTTDIKEANFFGDNGQYIVAGSDEGYFFIWERETTNLVRAMQGDSSIVNCLQPHPSCCAIATSGIDPNVKLWSPNVNDCDRQHVVRNLEEVAAENQKRMNTDPLESMLISMGMHFVSTDDENSSGDVMPCRTT